MELITNSQRFDETKVWLNLSVCTMQLLPGKASTHFSMVLHGSLRAHSGSSSTSKDFRFSAETDRQIGTQIWELLHHGRRAGIEKTTQIRVVSGETTFIIHI